MLIRSDNIYVIGKRIIIMKLLTYTRYLKQKIKFYDRLVSSYTSYAKNPFKNNTNSTTVIWVENSDDK